MSDNVAGKQETNTRKLYINRLQLIKTDISAAAISVIGS